VFVRIAGALVDSLGRWRYWGGRLNAVALLVFVLNVGRSLTRSSSAVPARMHASQAGRTG
jgi:hypothetical protein